MTFLQTLILPVRKNDEGTSRQNGIDAGSERHTMETCLPLVGQLECRAYTGSAGLSSISPNGTVWIDSDKLLELWGGFI